MATYMAVKGQHDAALAMVLGFDGYLRISELLNLKVQDVAIPNDARLGSAYRGTLLRLAKTKTGVNQSVTILNKHVTRILTHHIRGKAPADRVLSLTDSQLYRCFHGACSALGLDGQGFTPHSLRHGGATRHFLKGWPLEDIIYRGRWASAKSVRTYIQSGRALLLLTRVSDEAQELGSLCARVLSHLLLLLRH
jgi:integrase